MHKTVEQAYKKREYLDYCISQKFIFVTDVSAVQKIKQGIDLCVIKTNFSKGDLKCIKKLKDTNKNVEIWLASNNLSRENILSGNKIGIKTIVSNPLEKKNIESFFASKYNVCVTPVHKNDYDFSCIKNSKILLVDDNSMNVELLEEILSDFEIELHSYLKPKEALGILLHENFDLILLDIMMPEMSGFELAKRIREMPHNKSAQIVFISALSDSHNKIIGYDLGSVAYIEKPFDVNIVKSQIYNLLRNKRIQEVLQKDKESFLATVAHDLKTPIHAGINALNLLLHENLGKLGDDQQEIVEDLLNSTKFMQDMVENILCKNKLDHSKIELSKQVYSLKDIVEHCIDLTKYILEPKKQKIYFLFETENALLPLDFIEMKRAIHNLISNASEYSEIGGKILVRVFENDSSLCLTVQDFGKGIKLENQADVFNEYMSLANQHKRVGSGLGLYITKKIVEAHGGQISLESKEDYGTKITIELPIYSKS